MSELRALIREQLGDLALPPTREAEIVDELAELLRDAAVEHGVDLDDAVAARAFVERQLRGGGELASLLAAEDRGLRRATTTRSRRKGRIAPMSGLRQDLRYAVRVLRKSPVFALVAVATLAIGIGLNSAVFSLIDSTVLRPLPVEEGDRLVRLYSQVPDGFLEFEPMSHPDLVDIAETTQTLDRVYGYAMTMLALDWGEEPEIVVGEMVTGSYFPTLGVEPALGRLLLPEDDRRDAGAAVAVLSHASWQGKLGGDPGAVGRQIRINGQPVTVVGVAPERFRGLTSGLAPELWIPVDFAQRVGGAAMQSAGSRDDDLSLLDDRHRRWLWGGARLAPGRSVEEAASELATLGDALEEQYPQSNEERDFAVLPLDAVRLLPGVDEGVELASLVLMGGVGLILLIASANLANMLLARALGRRREIATRLSLGAGRARVARQLLVESLILALLGGGAGLAVAVASNRLLEGLELPTVVPISLDLPLDLRVVLFTLAISGLTAVVFGLAPALEASRADLASTLREEGASRGGSRGRRRLQGVLVVVQVALSVLLLTCAGLLLRSAGNAHDIDPGFEPSGLVVGYLDPELQGWEEERVGPLFERLREELASMPGAVAVSEASMLPLSLWINTWGVAPEGEEKPEREWPDVDTAIVGVDYFRTLEIPLLAGRVFTEGDRADSIRSVIVNETLARRFWPEGDALGRRVLFSSDGEPAEVVGIVADGRYRTLGEDTRPFLYVPSVQTGIGARFLIARFEGAPELAVSGFRRAVRGVDPHLALSSFGPMEEIMSPSLALPRMGVVLFGGFGTVGLLLAAVGLYGLLAYTVSQRRNEIGVRMAMGAGAGDIVSLVVRQGLVLTGLGAGLGVVLALVATRILGAALYGVSPTDPVTFSAVVVLMLAIAGAACWLPARRAARIDPNGALRS